MQPEDPNPVTGQSSTSSVPTESPQPSDVRGWIALLKSQLEATDGSGDPHAKDPTIEQIVASMSDAVERIVDEHAGMAEELLCVYDQLGVVFEVTGQLPGIRGEPDVLELFVDSLARSFSDRTVFPVWNDPDGTRQTQHTEEPGQAWLDELIDQARENRSVVVATPPGDASPGPWEGAMVAPVFAGEIFVCAIVLTRKPDTAEFRISDMNVVESLTTFCGDLIRNHRLAKEMTELSIAVVRAMVNAVDAKDAYTSGHSVRVAHYAMLLGTVLGLDRNELAMLQWSALLHDVGKIGIRENILNKVGKLTEEEFAHIRRHPSRGYEMIKEVRQLGNAFPGVLHHHEHYDGGGYPQKLSGERIPLQARIIQVADVFDALTSTRSYRSAHDWQGALSIMEREKGSTLDPKLQEVFDRMMREMLEVNPEAWEHLVERAGRLTRVLEESAQQMEDA